MKKTNFIKTVLLLCALVAGSGSVRATVPDNPKWVATALSSISDEATVIIISNSTQATNIALPSTATSSNPAKKACTVSTTDGITTITPPDGTTIQDLAWTLKKGESNYQFYQEGSNSVRLYLTGTSSNTALRVGNAQSSNDEFVLGDLGKLLKVTTASRFVGPYDNNGSDWRTYNTENATNYKGAELTFYVLQEGSEKTATTTTITSTGISNTYINQGTAAGSLSATVTETESGDAVDGATVTWSSSDTGVATIDNNGVVTLVAVGETDLTATYTGSDDYAGSSAKYTLTVTDSREDAELLFGEDSYECDKFDTFETPELLTADGFDGTVVYSSSDEDIATVNASTGAVTIKATGTTTISADSEATANFQAGHAEYTLTVTIHEGLNPVNPAGVGRYVKVTRTEDITDGNYLIVYEGNATHDAVAFKGSLEAFDAVANGIAVTITDNAIAATDAVNAEAFTIDTTTGFIQGTSGKYIGATSYTNSLVTSDDGIENSFAIEDGSATIGVTISEQTVTMRYNYASDQLRFRYYKSGQQAVQLYKYEAGSAAKVTLSADGYKTMVGTQPFSASGANIYIVTATDTEKATMTKITKAPANTPVILKGESNAEVSLSVEDSGDDASANLLRVSDENTGNNVYVLAKKDDTVAFYEWNGGSLGTGRVYLPKPSGNAREMISFFFEDEETTGINTTLTTNERMNNEVYNLNGQRVAQPTKGLYIVNGKKVIVK